MLTLTKTRPLKVGLNSPDYRKWDIVKFSKGMESIVIRVKNVGAHMNHSVQYTLYPYKRGKSKIGHWLWFKWLKLRVWIGDFYKH
jgi:hypothetical protein